MTQVEIYIKIGDIAKAAADIDMQIPLSSLTNLLNWNHWYPDSKPNGYTGSRIGMEILLRSAYIYTKNVRGCGEIADAIGTVYLHDLTGKEVWHHSWM